MGSDIHHLSILPLDKTATFGSGSGPSRVLEAIEANHGQLSGQLREYYGRRKSWLSSIFPSQLDKVLADGQLNFAKTEVQLNERIVELACEMKIQACRETADVWIRSMKLETRQTFIAFVTRKVEELEETIERSRFVLAERLQRRAATAEKFKDIPGFYEQYRSSMDKDLMDNMVWLDGLITQFRSIVDERIAEYGRPSLPIR